MPRLTKEQRESKKQEDTLIKDHLWIVEKRAKAAIRSMEPGIVEYEDLYAVALEGLYNAALQYDESTGYKFSSLAWVVTWGTIRHYLRDKAHVVRRNRKIIDNRNNVRVLIKDGKTYEEAADILNIKISDVIDCESSWKVETAQLPGDSYSYPNMLITPEPMYHKFPTAVRESIESLDDKDFRLLERFMDPIRREKMKPSQKKKAEDFVTMIKESYWDEE